MRKGFLHIVKKIIPAFIAVFFIANVSAIPICDALKLKISNGTYSDETVIRFLQGATLDFDSNYDAWKLLSANTAVPQIYTKIKPGSLSINAYPALVKNETLNLFATVGSIGSYTITATEIGPFSSNVDIFIENIATGNVQNLRTNPVYIFNVSDITAFNSNPANFIIRFSLPAPVISDFSFDTGASIAVNTQVNFINLSQNATSYSWDFGDGSSPSTIQDPIHTFSKPGNFPVRLIANTAMQSDTTVRMINVNVITQIAHSNSKEIYKLSYSNNTLTIDFNNIIQHNIALAIFTAQGREVARGKMSEVSKITLPVNEKESTIYIVKLQTNDTSLTKKIFIGKNQEQ
ncbi:MAG: PKD domain-containing protein [Bacteroidetes bacterium]|nr:PKD domain-containing protein [Bacteroidota bacterium]